MADPFDQGGWDPFGDLPTASKPQTPDLQSNSSDHAAGLRPARAAPPPPPRSAVANPFASLGASSNNVQLQDDDDPFGLLSLAPAAAAAGPPQLSSANAAAAAFDPPPPSYSAAAELPPPPAYEDAAGLPPPPPYAQAVGSAASPQQQPRAPVQPQQAATGAITPARAAPLAPPGPLHAGLPSRQPPAAPGPVPARAAPAPPGSSNPAGIVPARQAPPAPGVVVPARAAPPAPVPARPAPRPPPPAAAIPAAAGSGSSGISSGDPDWLSGAAAAGLPGQGAATGGQGLAHQQLSELSLAGSGSGSGASSWMSSSYATTGNVGVQPRSGACNSQQDSLQQVNAQIRLPPLNPKSAATLKVLAAGLGSLLAGPAGDSGQVYQWCPSDEGSTLPHGAQPTSREDHDSAACAELRPAGGGGGFGAAAAGGGGKGSRVSCMLLAPGPGWAWCGCTDGSVHCWSLGQAGGVARWLHSWPAHNTKVKALAVSPAGRLFTGAANGSMKMWSYGSPAFDSPASPPQLLRQLLKLEGKQGVATKPHSKVIGLAVSAGGRVLWSVGKNTINLWSTHNGEFLGTMSDEQQSTDGAHDTTGFAGGRPAGLGYGFAGQAVGQAGPLDINPQHGLDPELLDALFSQPTAELLAERDAAAEAEKDAAAVALNVAAKAGAKAGKLLGKLGNKIAAKLADEGWAPGGAGSGASGGEFGGAYAAAAAGSGGSFHSGGSAAAASGSSGFDTGLASKVERWGAIKKLAASDDGCLWLAYKRGLLERYSEGGQLLWSSSSGGGAFRPSGITALAAAGSAVWVGDQQGRLWVLDAGSCSLRRSWKGHVFPVRAIAAGGPLVFSLGKAGSIRAWSALPPPPAVTAGWQRDLQDCLQQQQLQVLVGTWNVNETRPSHAGLQAWLGERAAGAQLIMVGLQEVEMGTGSVVWDMGLKLAARDKLEAGTLAGQAWAAAVSEVLAARGGDWRRVGLRQMSGVLVLVYARAELAPFVGEVSTTSVGCGVMGMGGNKGAVAVSFSLFRRRVVVVSSHFAAHQDKVEARNADYAKIVRDLHFHNTPSDKPTQQQPQHEASPDAGREQQQQAIVPGGIGQFLARQQQQQQAAYGGSSPGGSPRSRAIQGAAGAGASAAAAAAAAAGDEDWGAGVRDAELLVWVGDFNYRVDWPAGFSVDRSLDPEQWPPSAQLYQFVHRKIAALQHLDLVSGDQLGREMARGAIFAGLAEGPLTFLPTYKFEKGRASCRLQPFYDQGEKKRVPAWTDRVLFRGSGAQRSALAANEPAAGQAAADVQVWLPEPAAYNSLMEVNDSDHKPVYALLSVALPWWQQQRRRAASLQALWQAAAAAAAALGGGSQLRVEPQLLQLPSSYLAGWLTVTAADAGRRGSSASSGCCCRFVVQGPGPGGALPPWLEVAPAAGVLEAGCSVRVRVQATRAHWGRSGAVSCELRVRGCWEGSTASGTWPAASAAADFGDSAAACCTVILQQ